MPIDHTKNIIVVENVSFAYDSEYVLKDITLEIHQGDYVGIVGPNGAGKTTLFKIMLGLLRPKSGTVKFLDQNINDFKDWQKIGYVPQKTATFDFNFPATVHEIVTMGRYRKGRRFFAATADDKQAVQNALAQVDMWGYKDRLIGDLSGGQQQRVFIARALVNDPEVVFLDEPTTGVDREAQDGFYSLLQRLHGELDLTIVLISHDIERITKEVMHIICVDRVLTCHTSPEEYLKESKSANILGQDVKIIAHHNHK